MIDVGEPGGEDAPYVRSLQTIGALELSASIQFVLFPIGSEGSYAYAGFGGMLDNVVSATQNDDWSGVPTLPSDYPKHWDYDLGGQIGGGGMAYAGVALSLGTARLVTDVRYVARTPFSDAKTYDWLTGRGVRIGMAMWFPL